MRVTAQPPQLMVLDRLPASAGSRCDQFTCHLPALFGCGRAAEELDAVDRRAQLAHQLQPRHPRESLADMLAGKTHLPVEAGARRVVDDRVGVGDQQMAAHLQCGRHPAREAGESESVADIVEHLAADDQLEPARERVAPHVELTKGDMVESAAALLCPGQGGGGDVGREQPAHPRCQLDGEMAFGTGKLQDPVQRSFGQQLQRMLVFPLLVGRGVGPGVGGGKQRFPLGPVPDMRTNASFRHALPLQSSLRAQQFVLVPDQITPDLTGPSSRRRVEHHPQLPQGAGLDGEPG